MEFVLRVICALRVFSGPATGNLTFKVNHYTSDATGGWWYDSSTYSISIEHGSEPVFLFFVVNGRIRDCAFTGQLSATRLRNAAKLLSREGLGGWVLPGLRGVCRFQTGLQSDMDPDKVSGVARLLLAWERSGARAVELPGQQHQQSVAAWQKARRRELALQRRYGALRINKQREVRLSAENPKSRLVYKTVFHSGSRETLWWYGEDSYAIYVESKGADVFSFYVQHGRVNDAAFPPELGVRQIRAAAELLEREGFGGWVLRGLGRTLWFLGSRDAPDARRIAALAKLVTEWRERGARG